MPEILSTIKVLAYHLSAKTVKVLIRCLLLPYMLINVHVIITNSLCGCLRHPKLAPAFEARGREKVQNNKCLK